MLIDAHCHFFTKNILSQRLLSAEHMAAHISKITKRMKERDKGTGRTMMMGANAVDFITTGLKNTPLQMYELMKESYGCDFIAVPLMLDLSYAMMMPKDELLEKKKGLVYTLKTNMHHLNERPRIPSNIVDSIDKKLDVFERSAFGIDVFENSYYKQIEDLSELKEQLPDRVYPFFSIDPRRNGEFENGILGEIKKYVGVDKPFLGLKLYTSLGYSPTHPALYDDSDGESVYGYCEKNKIPITIHSAWEGFSHMLDKSVIEGDIYYPPAGRPIPADHVYDDGIVKYEKNLRSLNFEDITAERLLMLNHPILWRKVLEKYPKLKLDMAHLGGVVQAYKFVRGDKSAFWPQDIIEIMDDFPNVYTDLSCYYEQDSDNDFLRGLYENVYLKLPKKIKNRVMYGSDYYMITLFNTELKDYINRFKDAFGEDYITISQKNPRRYLDI